MRFISAITAYRLIAVHDETTEDKSGFLRTTVPGYTVQFQKGKQLLSPREREIALERLHFRGIPVNYDRTPFDVLTRVSVFDTAWIKDDALRAKVEKVLMENADLGKQDGYILVEEEKIEAPWASYDELTILGKRNAAFVAEKNLETAATTGTPISHLIAYEKQNRNDERIIAAYEAAAAAPAEPAEELVQA